MSEEDETAGKSPEECRDKGLWEVDVVYYSLNGNNKGDASKSKRGKAYKGRSDSEYKCFEAHDGVLYRPGDHVYIEVSPCDPYFIGTISNFKMTKRDQLSVKVARFYRPDDVPEDSYALLLQERRDDSSLNHSLLDVIQTREVFTSETPSVYSICSLRGKCSIRNIKDIRALSECELLTARDTFFSIVSFDPNNSRLASVQGEIRVGGSYQVKVPQLQSGSAVDDPDRDELLWRPGYISEECEHVYKKATRSFRMFAMVRNTHITDLERDFRTGDLCADDAIVTLHKCGYNINNAIEAMNKNDEQMLKETNFMSADDAKKFARGIKLYGKNFLRIKKELLPHHERDELVQFYYGWKKTRDATRPKPLTRQRNAATATYRKAKNSQTKVSRPGSTDLADYASASETEMDDLESDGRAAAYACHHCYSLKSRDWHHSGKERQLLCTDCRIFYKKYGQLRPVDRPSTVPPSLHKPKSPDVNEEEEHGVRTRAGKKERRRTPSDNEKKSGSPQSVSDGDTKQRNGKRKRNSAQPPEHVINGSAKKRVVKEEKAEVVAEPVRDEESSNSSRENAPQPEPVDNKKGLVVTPKVGTFEPPEVESAHKNFVSCASAMPSTEGCSVLASAAPRPPAVSCVETPSTSSFCDMPITSNICDLVKKEEFSDGFSASAHSDSLPEPQPSTSVAVLPTEHAAFEEVKMEEEEKPDDGFWTVGDTVVERTKNALFVRTIERRCGQMCVRTDLAYRMKPGCEWDKKREARAAAAAKNHANAIVKKPIEAAVAAPAVVATSSAAQMNPLVGAPSVDAFMGGRVPMNGTAVGGIPGMFPGMHDPRLAFLNPQQQFAAAFALEQQQQAMQKQMEQQMRVHQLELMRNGANGTVTPNARDTPSRGGAGAHGLPPGMMPSPYHGFNMDPRAVAALMHNPQLAAQFGMGIDGHTAAMMNAFEQRSLEQRMLAAGMGGLEMLGPGNLPVSQAPPSHLHPHAAAMMQHAAAAAAQQPNGDALQLQQLLAMSAAAQAQRPFMEQNPLLQMSMMGSFGNEMAARMVNPGPLNSDMMRRLQQEGGFANASQRP